MSELVVTEVSGGVLRVGLNRPDKKNALTVEMYAALVEALERSEADGAAVRVILLHGTKDCFTAGNDLKDFLAAPAMDSSSPVTRFLRAISRAKKPIVAAVGGPAVGVGTTMLLHCDLVVAAENARFQLPFVNLGVTPEAACSYLLPQIVGYQRAAELLLLGEPFSAAAARDMGLVNAVVPADQLLETASDYAQKLAAKPAAALVATKSLLKRPHAEIMQETITVELEQFAERLKSEEAQSIIAAFFAKRPPS